MKLDDAFGIHEQALKLRAYRSEVLAANLANADTPGYKARDIDFHQVLKKEVGGVQALKTTHAGHMSGTTNDLPLNHLLYRTPSQPSLDGNTVDTHIENTKFSANALEYQASLSFLNGKIEGLLRAIRGD